MKVLVAVSTLVAIIMAEPPPSNSYLPPSSGQGGYPQGPQGLGPQGPQVIAARNLDQGHGPQSGRSGPHGGSHGGAHGGSHGGPHGGSASASAFARSNPLGSGPQGRFASNQQQGYDQNASPFGRNGLGESSEPANYNFGYMVNDYQEGTDFGHHEERQDEAAHGEYHVVLPDGRKQTVSYEADERGFKPHISYEDPEDASARSGGYDSNANNLRNAPDHGFANGGHGNGAGNHGNGKHGGQGSARSNGY